MKESKDFASLKDVVGQRVTLRGKPVIRKLGAALETKFGLVFIDQLGLWRPSVPEDMVTVSGVVKFREGVKPTGKGLPVQTIPGFFVLTDWEILD